MNQDRLLNRLPIAKNESIKHVFRHHWIVYAGPYLSALICAVIILIAASFVDNIVGALGGEASLALITIVSFLIILAIFGLASMPAYMRSQEMLILTEATLLLQRKPDVFAVKISQLNLKHVEDVNIERGFLGNVFNFGRLNIETAGEMENFIFDMVANIDDVARLIINSHENYMAALQTGHIQTTIEPREPMSGKAWHGPSSWPGNQASSTNPEQPGSQSEDANGSAANTSQQSPSIESATPTILTDSVNIINKNQDTNI